MPSPKATTKPVFRMVPLQMVAPSLAAVALAVLFGSNTGISLADAAFLGGLLLGWMLLWISQMLRIRSLADCGFMRDLHPAAVGFRIVFEPLLAIALAALLWSHQLTRLRLDLSSVEVDRFAENVLRDGIMAADADAERQLGLFTVHKVRVSNGSVKLFTCPDGILGPSGLLYSPKAKPENIGEETFTHLSGPWYCWKQTW